MQLRRTKSSAVVLEKVSTRPHRTVVAAYLKPLYGNSMIGILIILIPLVVAFLATTRGMQPALAWVLSWPIIPIFVLVDEFVLPYMGGGASMFPLALIFGGFCGVISGGVGAVLASIYLKSKNKQKNASWILHRPYNHTAQADWKIQRLFAIRFLHNWKWPGPARLAWSVMLHKISVDQ